MITLDPALAVWVLAALFFAVAALYASVGHAGASGYIAAMTLLSLPIAVIRPTALVLNLLVGSIGLVRYATARLVPWRLVLPLVAGSAPAAWWAASLKLPALITQRVLAAVLLVAAIQLWRTASTALADEAGHAVRPLPWPLAIGTGAVIGVIAGLSGTGGAIFLTPLLIFARFSTTRVAAGASVVFVLVNSAAALGGLWPLPAALPAALPIWLAAVGLGGLVGAQLGRGVLPIGGLRRALAVVLVIAAAKLALT